MSDHTGSTGVKRRDFLKVLGTAGAAVTTVGCASEKVGHLIPYLVHPDQTVSGVSTWYATTCRECAAGCGVIAETRDGRTTKLEGNPEHPLNRGALCARGQSALQGLYNPDRIRAPMVKEGGTWRAITWDDAVTRLSQKLGEVRSRGTAGNAIFLNQHESGSFPAFVDSWLAGFGMRPHLSVDFESDAAVIEANRRSYGTAWPRLSFADARLIVSFGADFLESWGMSVPQQLDFADARANLEGAPRFVYVGPRRSLTGLNADQWIACRPGTELGIANALAGKGSLADAARESGVAEATLVRLQQELAAAKPALVLAGARGSNALDLALAVAALNQSGGAIGTTIRPAEGSSAFEGVARYGDVVDAVERMRTGQVPLVFVRGVNPAHAMPHSANFADAFAKAGYRVSFSLYPDETTELCDLVLPDLHSLESWGTAEAGSRLRRHAVHRRPADPARAEGPGQCVALRPSGLPKLVAVEPRRRRGSIRCRAAEGCRGRCGGAAYAARGVGCTARRRCRRRGAGRLPPRRLSLARPRRWSRRQQAMAAGTSRPRHQGAMELVGRAAPRESHEHGNRAW
ncbi:MAG: molybdopterin-dependent oxidoreductase [Gemmatimonadaceae bacterium]|nr:molybdopterin-dependent oxidoreductase [Gemmatimonadaceae bacterium]